MPMLVKLESSAGFHPGVTPDMLCPLSWALAALHTAFLTHVHSRDNDLVPLLKGPQECSTGKTQGCKLPKG